MFESLLDQLKALPTVPGLTQARVLSLPEPIQAGITTLIREVHQDEIDLKQLAKAFQMSPRETEEISRILVEKGYLYELRTNRSGEAAYEIRYGNRQGRELPLELRSILQALKDIQLIEVLCDIGASKAGARHGAKALKQASFEFNRQLFADYPTIAIHSEQYSEHLAKETPFAKGIEAIYKVYEAVSGAVKQVLERGALPIVISGDHSTAGGTIAGIKMAYPTARLGVIWIDAHADIHSPYTSPSGNMHGMPVATALAEDNLDQQLNSPTSKTIEYWNKIKHLGITGPKINYEDLVYVAVRDTEPQEDYLINKHQIRNFTTKEVREKGVNAVVQEITERLTGCDRLYISFDVDSMDPIMVSDGTGTPVLDGLTDREAGQLISRLIGQGKVCCFEICEINPQLDGRGNRMGQSAFGILESATLKLSAH